MRAGYKVNTFFNIFYDNNCILVDNIIEYNKINNWHYKLKDAYAEKSDPWAIGVWKIKNK